MIASSSVQLPALGVFLLASLTWDALVQGASTADTSAND